MSTSIGMRQTKELDSAAAALAARLRQSTVQIRVEGHGMGSGVIWQPDGLILTNNHVLRGPSAEVVLADGRTLRGQVTQRDQAHDLAALRVDGGMLEAAPIGDSTQVRVGQIVLAMGHPLGIADALSMGIVHDAPAGDHGWLRADLSLLPGNSGGPLADARGRVIGVNTMVSGGLALAIPSNLAARFALGTTHLSFLGLRTQRVRLPAAMRLSSRQESGLLVLGLVEGGPADRHGLLPGDVLIAASGWPVSDHQALEALLRRSAAGTPVPLRLIRGGELMEITAVLGRRETRAA
jgi:serine protease Do